MDFKTLHLDTNKPSVFRGYANTYAVTAAYQLKKARELSGRTTEDVAAALEINPSWIERMESDAAGEVPFVLMQMYVLHLGGKLQLDLPGYIPGQDYIDPDNPRDLA